MKDAKTILAAALTASLLLTGCGSSQSADEKAPQTETADSADAEETNSAAEEKEPEPEPDLNLDGTWNQVNKNSEDMYQEMTISGDTMEIYWIQNNGDTRAIYWAGTFTPPTGNPSSYTWQSTRDEEKTDFALLASTTDTKDFTYENGQISYEVSAMGVSTIVRMEKAE